MTEKPDSRRIELMAYLDGEMSPEERQRFEQVLLADTELRREAEEFQKIKSILGRVRIPEPKPEMWDERARKGAESAVRGIGWILLVLGVAVLAVTLVYLLWSDADAPFAVKLSLTLLITGFVVLLGSVAERRRRESKTDRYREIIR